jgi:hypothetical protein
MHPPSNFVENFENSTVPVTHPIQTRTALEMLESTTGTKPLFSPTEPRVAPPTFFTFHVSRFTLPILLESFPSPATTLAVMPVMGEMPE